VHGALVRPSVVVRRRGRREIESESSGRMNSLPYHRPTGAPDRPDRRVAGLVDLSAGASLADNIVTAIAAAAAAAEPRTD